MWNYNRPIHTTMQLMLVAKISRTSMQCTNPLPAFLFPLSFSLFFAFSPSFNTISLSFLNSLPLLSPPFLFFQNPIRVYEGNLSNSNYPETKKTKPPRASTKVRPCSLMFLFFARHRNMHVWKQHNWTLKHQNAIRMNQRGRKRPRMDLY